MKQHDNNRAVKLYHQFWFRLLLPWVALVPEVQATTDCNAVTEIPVSECQSLIELYNSTNGPNWKDNMGWAQTNTPCSWIGVTCHIGHVIEVVVIQGDTNVTGQIPDLNLPNLTGLGLSLGQLSGSIPNFSQLPNLQHLYLAGNQLNGSIPNFSNLPNLTELLLFDNQLSGSIPNFSQLPNLQHLVLADNQLSGSIPDFSNLPELEILRLDSNQLSGSIPNFSNLPKLGGLMLSDNQLSGNIPNFSQLPNLHSLLLDSNQLSGSIPNFTAPNLATSYLGEVAFSKNCGLTAYDAAQESMLNLLDPDWQTRNPNCSASTTVQPPSTSVQPLTTPLPLLGDHFTGGIAIRGQSYQAQGLLTVNDHVEVTGNITVDPTHVGKTADLFVYVEATLPPATDPLYLMLGEGLKSIPVWDRNPDHLIPFLPNVTLNASQTLTMYTGPFIYLGTFKVFFGYRLPNGTIVASTQPITITSAVPAATEPTVTPAPEASTSVLPLFSK